MAEVYEDNKKNNMITVAIYSDSSIYITDSTKPDKILAISKKYFSTNNYSLVTKIENDSKILRSFQASVIIGTIQLKLNKYIIFGTNSLKVGCLKDQFQQDLYHDISKVIDYEVIPFDIAINQTITQEEGHYLNILKTNLLNSSLYYSKTLDLTITQQELNKFKTPFDLENTNKKFQWNSFLSEDFQTNTELNCFITPIIYGYVKCLFTNLFKEKIQLCLITRRATSNAGTRYFRRGADSEGNVANFNETEQILYVPSKDRFISYLQIRGSVPIEWCEVNNLKYKPQLFVNNFEEQSFERGKKHFQETTRLYGDNYLINLVNHKGYELPVKEGYEKLVEKIHDDKNLKLSGDVKYIYFDFHKECGKMKWDNVNNLLKTLQNLEYQNKDSFFEYNLATKTVLRLQQNIVRSNCMDCLDRTNVVQSVLAGWQLQKQFCDLGILPPAVSKDGINNFPMNWKQDKELLSDFQNLWADNANYVSLSYSGTGALKTDFTRTGKRTYNGALQDLKNSIVRYFKNNYKDGERQDGYDLVLGKFKPYDYGSSLSPFEDRRTFAVQALPSVLYVSVLIVFTTLLKPFNGHFNNIKNLSVFSVSLITIILCLKYCLKNGMQFVQWPKFISLESLQLENRVTKDNQFKGIWFKVANKYITNKKDL